MCVAVIIEVGLNGVTNIGSNARNNQNMVEFYVVRMLGSLLDLFLFPHH